MKNTFFKLVGTGTLAILTLTAFAQIEASGQEIVETNSTGHDEIDLPVPFASVR